MKKFLSGLILIGACNSFAQCEDFTMTYNINTPTCYNYSDGNIEVIPSGGTGPYSGWIKNENGFIVGGGKTFLLMGGGWYYIYLTDANGCELYDSVYLENPPEIVAMMTVTDPGYPGACDGIAIIDTVLNYQGNYEHVTYYWSPGGPYGLGAYEKDSLCDANYNVVVQDMNGCFIIEYLAVGSVGFNDPGSESTDVIFPNPAVDFITIRSGEIINRIEIIDYSGKVISVIQETPTLETIVDVNFLSRGCYFVRIIGEHGEKTVQFIKD